MLIVGQFLVLLQLVKLWEQRTNRDYWQLLVLGLLMMVAAAISTSSLWFGLLFLLYLVLSLYCCLLFHLKVESENAGAAMAIPRHRFSRSTLSQDQRYLSSSVWRLAALGPLRVTPGTRPLLLAALVAGLALLGLLAMLLLLTARRIAALERAADAKVSPQPGA